MTASPIARVRASVRPEVPCAVTIRVGVLTSATSRAIATPFASRARRTVGLWTRSPRIVSGPASACSSASAMASRTPKHMPRWAARMIRMLCEAKVVCFAMQSQLAGGGGDVSKRGTEIWLAVIAIPISLLLTFVAGLHLYMTRTATPLHPDPDRIPFRTKSEPAARWAAAVEGARRAMREGLSEQNLPGLAAAVGIGGESAWAEGAGWADLEKHEAVSPDMRFRIGTASVPLTSAAAGLLIEGNRLKLDEGIQTYMPEFPYKEWSVTLRQLMSDTSGVPNDGGDEGPLFTKRCEHPAEAFQYLSGYEVQLLFEPGSRYNYSSYGWIAVSAAIEAAAGEPLVPFMRKQIFEPLRMDATSAESSASIPAQVTSYFPRYAANPRYGPDVIRTIGFSCYSGSSMFVSTPTDLVRFGMAIDSGKLLRPATVQSFHTPQRLSSGEPTSHGLGWDLQTVTLGGEEAEAIGHDGKVLGGPVGSLIILPGRGMVVAVLSNISYADTRDIAVKVAQAFAAQ